MYSPFKSFLHYQLNAVKINTREPTKKECWQCQFDGNISAAKVYCFHYVLKEVDIYSLWNAYRNEWCCKKESVHSQPVKSSSSIGSAKEEFVKSVFIEKSAGAQSNTNRERFSTIPCSTFKFLSIDVRNGKSFLPYIECRKPIMKWRWVHWSKYQCENRGHEKQMSPRKTYDMNAFMSNAKPSQIIKL